MSEKIMSPYAAKDYHRAHIAAFHAAGADIVSAVTLNYINEGIGIVTATQEVEIHAILSFTVRTNDCFITGESLQTVIESIDSATDNGPAYYMINCAHSTHFSPELKASDLSWKYRIGGIRECLEVESCRARRG
jgi:S-methylmethionine-dependent homocysteine/selenocysteine methylase